MLRLTNTLTGAQEEFHPEDGQTVRMYTCGPTVYNHVHIGNLRTFVYEDILRRHLRSKWRLKHVMNITDIDDKIINRAVETGQDIQAYTAPYTNAFFEDCEKLRIERPDAVTPATQYIPEMIELVSRLLEKGYAYREGDSIYYRIARFPSYGRLSRLDKRELRVGARIDADEYAKEEPRDFVLWKGPKDDREPRWKAPFGDGRPGWHLECSAMAMKLLGKTIDIHCGGVDNIFPHHENEIAQSEAVTGRPFVRFWIHGEHLMVENEKMAKSKGNFFTLGDLLDRGHDPLEIRYALVSVPYRKQMNFTFGGLWQAQVSLKRIKEFMFRLKTAKLEPGTSSQMTEAVSEADRDFENGLDDDLNTARALAALFDLIRKGNTALSEGAVRDGDRKAILDFLAKVDDRLAIVPPAEDVVDDDEGIESLIEKRNEARRNRNFSLADEIRQQLLGLGVIIEDTREGTKWRRK